ncbi:hypothetical protein [uncultured Arcobacter sp.]|uniref:hypothetical protein n=1 Tax=uncultured Arcobacter sp. TaxID=165434 RepID=UPI00261E3BB1|nr:hypothetical protein [uncultured Arcobacter sp.]
MSKFKLHYSPNCPIDIFNHAKLNNNEKMIFIVIHNIIGSKEKKCILTNEDIASASHTSYKTVVRAINKLSQEELIWIDVDRKRAANDKNEAVRHIYTNYKYYLDRNKQKPPILRIPKFNSIHHFRNWCKQFAVGFECTVTKADGAKTPILINDKGHIVNTTLNREYNPTKEKETIYYIWEKLYKNHETVTNYVKSKQEEKKDVR